MHPRRVPPPVLRAFAILLAVAAPAAAAPEGTIVAVRQGDAVSLPSPPGEGLLAWAGSFVYESQGFAGSGLHVVEVPASGFHNFTVREGSARVLLARSDLGRGPTAFNSASDRVPPGECRAWATTGASPTGVGVRLDAEGRNLSFAIYDLRLADPVAAGTGSANWSGDGLIAIAQACNRTNATETATVRTSGYPLPPPPRGLPGLAVGAVAALALAALARR